MAQSCGVRVAVEAVELRRVVGAGGDRLFDFRDRTDAAAGSAEMNFPASGMDKDHKILLDALGFDPADLDVLVVRTGFKPEAVSSMMLILELEGHVQAAPGGRYSRVVRSRR